MEVRKLLLWPEAVKNAMVKPQNIANAEAVKYEKAGQPSAAFELRVFGRLNGLEDGLIELSRQLAELHDKTAPK